MLVVDIWLQIFRQGACLENRRLCVPVISPATGSIAPNAISPWVISLTLFPMSTLPSSTITASPLQHFGHQDPSYPSSLCGVRQQSAYKWQAKARDSLGSPSSLDLVACLLPSDNIYAAYAPVLAEGHHHSPQLAAGGALQEPLTLRDLHRGIAFGDPGSDKQAVPWQGAHASKFHLNWDLPEDFLSVCLSCTFIHSSAANR